MPDTQIKVLSGLRALLAVPTYGPVDPACAKDLRLAVMTAANHGLTWAGDASPDRMGFSAGRNRSAQALLNGGKELADGIMWVDSDIRMKPSDITALIASAKQYQADFVSGVYHQRSGDHDPVFYEYNPKKKTFKNVVEYPENAFAPIGGCGFGFVWTSYELIDAIAKHKSFEEKWGWFPDRRDSGGFGEDLSFCYLANLAGYQLYINTSIQLGHTGEPEVVYREQYLESRKKKKIEAAAEREKPNWGKNAIGRE